MARRDRRSFGGVGDKKRQARGRPRVLSGENLWIIDEPITLTSKLIDAQHLPDSLALQVTPGLCSSDGVAETWPVGLGVRGL